VQLLPGWSRSSAKTFLDNDYSAINDQDFFVRGIIELPVLGSAENIGGGVRGSLSRQNFKTMLDADDNPKRVELPPMFSWLSSLIPDYPDTLGLKMYARVRRADWRPYFDLEPSEHPLSIEQRCGIAPERIQQIMIARLGNHQ
jgi:hypothetical protein